LSLKKKKKPSDVITANVKDSSQVRKLMRAAMTLGKMFIHRGQEYRFYCGSRDSKG
jgi:hypothetical protein